MVITAGIQSNNTDIFYIEGTTTRFHNGYHSSILEGIVTSFSLYKNTVTHSAGRKLGIQSLPNSDYENMVIPVGVKAALGTEITFSATAINLSAGIRVFLEDRDANIFTELALANTAYNVRLAEETNGVGRFYLHTKQEVLNVSWNGNADSDWLNTANWSTRIISVVNAIVTIPSCLARYPTANGAVSVHSIVLNSGSSFIANSTFAGSLTYN